MKEYEILEHKADLKIRAFGKTKEELFLNMMKGMISASRPKIKNQKSRQGRGLLKAANIKNFKIKSVDINALLVDFLNECLYSSQVNREIYQKIEFRKFSDTELEYGVLGQKVERFDEDIKAATYHGLDIKQNSRGLWQAEVIFDV